MKESLFCRIGLHRSIFPLKYRAVGYLLHDFEVCSRCHKAKTYDSGWYLYDDWEKYFDEAYLVGLERSCFSQKLSKSLLPFDSVANMKIYHSIMDAYDEEHRA